MSSESFSEWRLKVNAIFIKKYCIDIEMAGIDDGKLMDHYNSGEDAQAFVEWWGEKYGLIEDFP